MVLRGAPGKTGRTILALTACVSATLSSVPADAEPPNVYELVAQAGALAANSMVALTQQLVAAQNAANQAQAAALQAQINDINAFIGSSQQATQQAIMAIDSMIASTAAIMAGMTASINMVHAASCPVFVGQSTLLGEDACLWAKVSGEWVNQYGADTDAFTWRVGGQAALAPGWYLGGTLAAITSSADAPGGTFGRSQAFDTSVALKHLAGPWLFTSLLGFAMNWTHTTRPASVAGASPLLQSDLNAYRGGAALRAAYDFPFESWYVRPRVSVDVTYVNVPAFQESGSSAAALSISGRDKLFVILSPALEAGARFHIGEKTVLRSYATIGAMFVPDNSWTIDASFVGPFAALGSFRTTFYGPTALAVAEAGLQLYEASGNEVRAEYKLIAGDNFLSQTASLRLAYHF
jgi:uncharacterized protein YhjY with autotransporter beta-barrel domain